VTLHDSPVDQTLVLHDTEVAVLLAVFLAAGRAQKHHRDYPHPTEIEKWALFPLQHNPACSPDLNRAIPVT
jgi:hypothetical protein